MKDYSETRQSNGQFGANNPGGPGRPRREVEQMYLDAAIRVISLDRWVTMVEVAMSQAEAGDKDARKWISENFTIGKPTERLELTQEDNTVVTLQWGSNRSELTEGENGQYDTPALPPSTDGKAGQL